MPFKSIVTCGNCGQELDLCLDKQASKEQSIVFTVNDHECFHEKEETPISDRFIIEQRSGIIAIHDTGHNQYKETSACHGYEDWCIAFWNGTFDETERCWSVEAWKIDRAKETLSLLNTGGYDE